MCGLGPQSKHYFLYKTLCEVASVINNTICVGLEGKELQYHYDFKRLGWRSFVNSLVTKSYTVKSANKELIVIPNLYQETSLLHVYVYKELQL